MNQAAAWKHRAPSYVLCASKIHLAHYVYTSTETRVGPNHGVT